MSHFKSKERTGGQLEFTRTGPLKRDSKNLLPKNLAGNAVKREQAVARPYLSSSPPQPAGTPETAQPKAQSPYVIEVEVACDECGGSGFDPGGIDPWGPESCPACHGAKTQKITRNYLAEAFRIAASPESTRPVERQHLIAIVQHCRQAVSAIVGLPEIHERAQTHAQPKSSSRHSRSRSQSHAATHIKRRKTEC